MRVGIVTFPGTVDASDVSTAVAAVGGEPVTLTHTSESLDGIDAVVLPGGASYSDHLRPGALARHTPVMEAVIGLALEGLPVLGIGNGFQTLCEARLLPGALTTNGSARFISAEQSLRVETRDTVWTNQFETGEVITLMLKSGSGRYIATSEVLDRLEASDQVVFRYLGINPNQSLNNIAGITNERGNVVGLMAHPEYAVDTDAAADGRRFFTSLMAFLDVVSTPRMRHAAEPG
ncbi:MAG TPA: phosphoribosylformylglycinamidine synthase subunit PurQ [Propionibacteriaceae bacterium]|nr:phosphoribosylformylglycinamidine synthase subunit PurQ [Propionibacteriaceae bacterium]